VLVIRDQQMRILQEFQLRQFEDSLAAHLAKRFPRSALTTDADFLRSMIREGLRVAKTFGIVNRTDVRRFLEFSAEYGTDFYLKPWAAKILGDPTLSGCGKMEQMDAYSVYVFRPWDANG
jgi:hypothetical protein